MQRWTPPEHWSPVWSRSHWRSWTSLEISWRSSFLKLVQLFRTITDVPLSKVHLVAYREKNQSVKKRWGHNTYYHTWLVQYKQQEDLEKKPSLQWHRRPIRQHFRFPQNIKGKLAEEQKYGIRRKIQVNYPKLFGMGDRLARSHSLYDPNYYPIHWRFLSLLTSKASKVNSMMLLSHNK